MAVNCQEIANSLAIGFKHLNTIWILLFISHIHMMLLCTKRLNAVQSLTFTKR